MFQTTGYISWIEVRRNLWNKALGRSFVLGSLARTSSSRILIQCSVRNRAPLSTRDWFYCFTCSGYTKHLCLFFEQSECTVERSVSIKQHYHTKISYTDMIRCKIIGPCPVKTYSFSRIFAIRLIFNDKRALLNLIICTHRQMLFGWSNRGEWDGRGM
jgi:hypothetical protein